MKTSHQTDYCLSTTILVASVIFFLIIFLSGCASSGVSRTAAGSIDDAYVGLSESYSDTSLANSYDSTSQTAKGVLIGGVTGGVAGGLTNGIGLPLGAVTGAILGGAIGAYIDSKTTLVDKIENAGAKVFVLGDHVLVVIQSDRIFDENGSRIRDSGQPLLNMVSQLIGNYVNMSVKVAAYTSDSGAKQIDCALSQLQAESVAKYLWKRCMNTRLIYAQGYGGSHLVEDNSLEWGHTENFRVEITFEKLPV